MFLHSLPSSLAGYNNSFSNINCCTTTIKEGILPAPKKDERHIFLRTTGFIKEISQRFFKQTKTAEVKALQDLLWFVSKNGVTPIQNSLFKKSGFFSRLFSNESWGDWCENKTPVGRVISLYCDCVTSSTPLEVFMERLDEHLLEVSNRDAALLLKSLQDEKSSSFKSKKISALQSSSYSLPATGVFPPIIDCSNLNGTDGFILNGEKAPCSTLAGTSVSKAGDVNGDGIADFIVGAPGYPGYDNGCVYPNYAGRSYLIFGKKSWTSPISLTDLHGVNGYNGFMLDGGELDVSGSSVNSAGDINGDGIDDLIIGAEGILNENPSGPMVFSYVVFGKKGNWNSPISLRQVNGSNGFFIYGGTWESSLMIANSVGGVGDINGDGIDDLIIGDGSNSATPEGWTFVLFGRRSNWSSSIDVSSLDGANGFILYGTNSKDLSGKSVSGAGDINGDGINDFIIGAPGADAGDVTNAGRAYVIFGSKGNWSSSIHLSDLNGQNGFILNGQDTGDNCGTSVSSAGDINSDGIGDFIIGAPGATVGGKLNAGLSYVVFGSNTKWISPFDFTSLNGSNGFAIGGIESDGKLGSSVRGAGDINGDGIDDLIIGAPKFVMTGATGVGKGKSYIIFGQKGSWTTPFDLSTLNGANGFTLYSSSYSIDVVGASVSGAGDINDDGIDDLVVGAPAHVNSINYPRDTPGDIYVIFGKKVSQNPNNQTNPTNPSLIIGLSIGGGIAFVGLTAFAVYFFNKRRNRIGAQLHEIQPLVN